MIKQGSTEFDDLFKKKLEDPGYETGFREEDWTALESLLENHKRRKGIVYLFPIISSIAALLLLFFGWWFFQPKVNRGNDNPTSKFQAVTISPKTKTDVDPNINNEITSGNKSELSHKKTSVDAGYALKGKRNKLIINNGSMPVLSSRDRRKSINSIEKTANDGKYVETLAAVSEKPEIGNEEIEARQINLAGISKSTVTPLNAVSSSNSKSSRQSASGPRYTLSVLAAPDINGAGSFQQSKVGTNVGLLFSAGLYKKFTISTGVLYSAKPYSAGNENYNLPASFKINPLSIVADCKMLDIPLNVGYQVYHKKQNRLTIGTGLSSYIMLHEAYRFNYVTSTANWSSNFTVPNSNKYFFGVYNLNATYERQINSKAAIMVQPYLKLPLTAIGYSQVRLQTTGVAVGLSWNINSSTP
jgi:hypothetical protein